MRKERAKSSREGAGDGRRLLIEALKKQDIVEHNEALASLIADNGELVEFEPNAEIVVQDASDNDVYFIVSGETNVFINGRFRGSREAGTTIGEMAAMDAAAPRSATVRAKENVVALKVTEPAFRAALDAHPIAYRPLAQVIAARLRQTAQLHQPPNPEPVLFLGCSTEKLTVARAIQSELKHDRIEVQIWTQGVFGPSGVPL